MTGARVSGAPTRARKKRGGLEIGERVAYARTFLRNTGMFTGWAPFARGVVLSKTSFAGGELCRIQWDNAPADVAERPYIRAVLDCNLVRVADLHKEPA